MREEPVHEAEGLDASLLDFESPAEDRMQLVFHDETNAPCIVELSGRARTTIGRDGACDLVFRDAHVSRRHATIEVVQGQHLLRDEGSANGTFLNGLRLGASNAFALRARDVIEIGPARIHFVAAGERPVTPVSAVMGDDGAAFERDALLEEGLAVLGAERERLRGAVLGAFAGVGAERGLERLLPLVAGRLEASAVAVFLEDSRHALRAAAAHPVFEAAGGLLAPALRAWRDGRGRIVRGVASLDAPGLPRTWVQNQTWSAVVPIDDGTRRRGVLAAQREGGVRLRVADLAVLAVIAARAADAVALGTSSDPGDTRT